MIVHEREGTVQFAENGIKMTRPQQFHVRPNPLAGFKRGRMDGRFSRGSALNLRRKLACLPSDTFRLFGVTLTMPAQSFRGVDDFRVLWRDFTSWVSHAIRRGDYTDDFGFVWRVELTKGDNDGKVRTPHFHVIVWSHEARDVQMLAADWCKNIERHYGLAKRSLDPQIAALYTELTSCQQAFQYVANHTTKHKRTQLGWPGRQWGVFYGTKANRARMAPILGRFDNKPISELRKLSQFNSEQDELLAHGNSDLFRKCPL